THDRAIGLAGYAAPVTPICPWDIRLFRRDDLRTRAMPRNAVARDVMWLGAATALFAVEQLVFRAITLADLPVSEYGRLSLVLSIYAVLMMIGASGVPNTVARFVAGRQDADSRDEAAII